MSARGRWEAAKTRRRLYGVLVGAACIFVGASLSRGTGAGARGVSKVDAARTHGPASSVGASLHALRGRRARGRVVHERSEACAVAAPPLLLDNSDASCAEIVTSTFPYLGHDVFRDACHHVYVPGQDLGVTSPSLVYLHPRDIGRFGEEAVPGLRHNIVLVSNSNMDECLPFRASEHEPSLRDAYTRILASPRVVAWYGPNVVAHHPKLKPLPLGGKWNWRSTDHHGEDENKGRIVRLLAALARDPDANFRRPDKPNLLFTRMDASTSDSATYAPTRGHRRAALAAAEKIVHGEHVAATTASHDNNATCASQPAFAHVDRLAAYLEDMRTHKFVLSPPGNGLDTHRTWEALLMGAIPVVESSAMDAAFQGLPVLILDSWAELTAELLERRYAEFQSRQNYCWGKLYAPFYLLRMVHDVWS